MVPIKTNLANKGNYGGARSLDSIKYIVIHYTANDGDTDENNGNYFKNNVVESSAHYFVDDDSITQSVPDNYIAWHCGAKTYKHPVCRNANSIGIEICDDVKNGVIYPSAKTIANAIELTEFLMKKYNIPKANVIRHYDVMGKICPAYWSGTPEKDAKWKTEFWNKLNDGVKTMSTTQKNAKINGINTARLTDDLILYTGKTKTGTNQWGVEVALDANGVAINNPEKYIGNMTIPANGYVLSGHGKNAAWILDNIKKGTKIKINSHAIIG